MDMSRGSKFKDGIRIAAAAYLIYLGVKVISDVIKGATEGRQILFVIFGIVFIAVGIWIGLWSVKSLLKEAEKSDDGSGTEENDRNIENSESVTAKEDPERIEADSAAPEHGESEQAEQKDAESEQAEQKDAESEQADKNRTE